MLQIILIVAVGWVALSVLVLPVVMLIGRAGYRADLDALLQHQELLTVERTVASARPRPVHVSRA